MSALIDAARAALDALESLQGGCTDSGDGTVEAITVWCPEVIDALRAALAAAEAQPPTAQMSSVAQRKTADLLADDYRVVGYVLAKEGARTAVQIDAAVRWLMPDEQHRLMFVEGSLDAAPVAQPVVPQGWRLVPVEPTREMLNAGILRHQDAMGSIGAAYRAMCAAAPAAPAAQPLGWQPIETAPRDETRVLLLDPQRIPSEMIGRWRGNAWWGDATPSGRSIIWRDDSGSFWMPLPAAPGSAA